MLEHFVLFTIFVSQILSSLTMYLKISFKMRILYLKSVFFLFVTKENKFTIHIREILSWNEKWMAYLSLVTKHETKMRAPNLGLIKVFCASWTYYKQPKSNLCLLHFTQENLALFMFNVLKENFFKINEDSCELMVSFEPGMFQIDFNWKV